MYHFLLGLSSKEDYWVKKKERQRDTDGLKKWKWYVSVESVSFSISFPVKFTSDSESSWERALLYRTLPFPRESSSLSSSFAFVLCFFIKKLSTTQNIRAYVTQKIQVDDFSTELIQAVFKNPPKLEKQLLPLCACNTMGTDDFGNQWQCLTAR